MTQPGAAGGYETAVGGAEDGDAFLKHRNTVCLGMENNGGNGGEGRGTIERPLLVMAARLR